MHSYYLLLTEACILRFQLSHDELLAVKMLNYADDLISIVAANHGTSIGRMIILESLVLDMKVFDRGRWQLTTDI